MALSRSEAAQEFEIAALDQGDGVVNEPVRLTTGMRILPLDRTTPGVVGGKHLRSYVSRAAAEVMDVEGVEELNQPPLLERCQPQSRR